MKINLITFYFFLSSIAAAQIPIDSARLLPPPTVVTVRGIAVNGAELGNSIRYIQDGTAGIGIFSTQVSSVIPGDEIQVTGELFNFNGLLEIKNLSSFSVLSSGNNLPSPLVLNVNNFSDDIEGQLVRVNNCSFSNPIGNFAGGSSYAFIDQAGHPGELYLNGGNPTAGNPIPISNVDLIGVLSDFNGFQLLPRSISDIIQQPFFFTISPFISNLNNNSLEISWSTNLAATTLIAYGLTPALELGYLQLPGTTTNHVITIPGLQAASLVYYRATSVSGTDTARGTLEVAITQSNSSGAWRAYFNRNVNTNVSLSSSNNAVYLNGTFADTIKAYIDLAQSTLDIAIYNFTDVGTGSIVQAINAAHQRGVRVRIIADGSTSNTALLLLNPAIPILKSPDSDVYFSYGIMHNKFLVVDAYAVNANHPWVLSGSTNWTGSQLEVDANNMLFVQDQSLAKTYQLEFEEMWGSNTAQPDTALSKFGPDKTDNTPHYFIIGGKEMRCYFSPTDNVNNQIISTISTATQSLHFALLSFTRNDIANEIVLRNSAGIYASGIINDLPGGAPNPQTILSAALGNAFTMYDAASLPGILHHKFLIVDQELGNSNARLLNGSHNWSTSANFKNDENTLIIHDQLLANQYYQAYHHLMSDNGVSIGIDHRDELSITVFPNPASKFLYLNINKNKKMVNYKISGFDGRVISSGKLLEPVVPLPADMVPGLYYLTIDADQEIAVMKFIKY